MKKFGGLLFLFLFLVSISVWLLPQKPVNASTKTLGTQPLVPTYSWTKTWPANGDGYSNGAITDSEGSTYVWGRYKGTDVDFNPGTGTDLHTSPSSGTGYGGFLVKFDASGNYLWGGVWNAIDISGERFAVNPSGNIIMTFSCSSSVFDYDLSEAGTNTQACNYMGITTIGKNGNYVSSMTLDLTDIPDNYPNISIYGMGLDTQGNIVLGGWFGGTVDFDPSTGKTEKSGSPIAGFIVKYNANQTLAWVKAYSSDAVFGMNIKALDVDSATDKIYFSGLYSGTVNFNQSGGNDSKTAPDGGESFLSIVNSDGTYGETKLFDKNIAFDQMINDSQGNIYLMGEFTGSVIFNPPAGQTTDAVGGDRNIFITKYNSAMGYLWTKTVSSTSFIDQRRMAVTSADDIVLTGYFSGNVDFDNDGNADLTDSSANQCAMYVFAINNAGQYVWSRAPSGGDMEDGYGIAISGNSLYVVGDVYGSVNFNPNGQTDTVVGVANGSAFLTKYSLAAAAAPTVTTGSVSAITTTGATVGGNVTADGGVVVTERGVVYSSSNNTPTISDSKQTTTGTIGAMTADLTGLTVATQYYARAYATNSVGTSYGDVVTFTTTAAGSAPTVTTTIQIPAYGATTAQVLGNVTADGGASITERGVVYSSSNQTPTTGDGKQTTTGTTGAMTVQLSGLTPYTTYYVRAYATNSAGTGYGAVVTFRTIPMTLQNVYFTFGKLQYGKYASPSTLRTGDNIYLKNYDPKKIQLLAISLYDYTIQGNQCYTRSWKSTTSMYMKTCGLLPTKRKYAFIFTFKDVATGVVVKKYFVINTISAGTITL